MVKVQGPLMSLDASGTIADAVTFSKWKGRNYVRERVIPSNPQSVAQTGRRAMFRFLTVNWDAIADVDKATYQDLADQLVASPFNAYLSANVTLWHNFLPPSQATPATRIATPSDNALTAAAWEENRIKLTIEGTTLADAWGILIFAKAGASPTPGVGTTILVELETVITEHFIFWTPPERTSWTINTITFADDGAQAIAGGGQTAVPP